MDQRNKSKKVTCSYKTLNELRPNTKVDVYGVVKFIKPPYKTRGSDYCTMISIIDPSMKGLDEKLKCLLFAKEESKLPNPDIGDIVRFHRLSVSMFGNSLQGQSSPGFSWLVISGCPQQPLEPKNSSSPTYSFTDADNDKIRELRTWASKKDEFRENLCSFSDVATGCYFDIYCQLVSTSVIEDGVGRLLRVWDATQCLYNVREVSSDSQLEDTQTDEEVFKRARGFIYDVSVFDDHFRSSSNIKPGDYVKFVNLHASEWKDNERSHRPAIEFCLHHGNSFGRCVRVVSPDSPDLISLKQRQEIVALDNESFSITGINSQAGAGNSSRDDRDVATDVDNKNKSGTNAKTDIDKQTQFGTNAQRDYVNKHNVCEDAVSERNDKVEVDSQENNIVEDVIVISSESQEASSEETRDKTNGKNAELAGNNTKPQPSTSRVGDPRGAVTVRQDGKDAETDKRTYRFKRAAINDAKALMVVENEAKQKQVNKVDSTDKSGKEHKNTRTERTENPVLKPVDFSKTVNESLMTNNVPDMSLVLTCDMNSELVLDDDSNENVDNLETHEKTHNSDTSNCEILPRTGQTFANKVQIMENSSEDIIMVTANENAPTSSKRTNQRNRKLPSERASETQEFANQRRCMVQTSTVVLDHPHVPRTHILDVLNHAVPYKFRVRAQVLDYHPKLDSAKSFLKLYCHVCHYLCPYPEKENIVQNGSMEPQLQIGSTFQDVPHYNCPRCFENRYSLPALDSPPHLKYIFMLRFILSDETGLLMANIWKEDAVQLFQDMQPEDLLKKESNVEIVKDYLKRICPDDTALSEKPWIEGCLRSFSNACGTGYQMFDTLIV